MEVKNEHGCGFIAAFFPARSFKPRTSVMSQPYQDCSKPAEPRPKKVVKLPPARPKRANCREKRVADGGRTSSSSSNTSGSNKTLQVVNGAYTKKQNEEPSFTSNELSLTLVDQRKVDTDGKLFRASTGNVMLSGHLGNLKQQGKEGINGEKDINRNGIAKKLTVEKRHQYGNILHSSANSSNPEVIKSLGNDKYKQGKYEKALALYDKAIAIDPTKACYYSNKSAALIGLGRFLEATVQCREAIRVDASYHNAHYRLGNLYFRLGLPEKAVYHYKCSGYKTAGFEEIKHAEALKTGVHNCFEAQSHEDWNKLVIETQNVLSLGADSATEVYAMNAEALLKLHRHEEAYAVVQSRPCFSHELNCAIFGSSASAGMLAVRAQVYMSSGRFEDAVSDIQKALSLDPSSKTNRIAERVKNVASARSKGNRLYKESKITEALIAYNEGLEKDPCNSILLCNRAACRSKLRQYEKAAEDCTAALVFRPNYRKARLRRANCNAAMERWEAAIQDYELLMQECSKDDEEEVRAGLLEAKIQCNKLAS